MTAPSPTGKALRISAGAVGLSGPTAPVFVCAPGGKPVGRSPAFVVQSICMNAVLDAVYLACADLAAATAPYERIGLHLTPLSGNARVLPVGLGPRRFRLHFLAGCDTVLLLAEPFRQARQEGRALFAVGLRAADWQAEVAALRTRGVPVVEGSGGVRAALLPVRDRAAVDLLLTEDGPAPAGAPVHDLPLQRLDHLAAVAHDLDAITAYWTDMLGVAVAGEVRTATLLIRQLRLGDAVLELLAGASPDSPLHQRPPGLVSMASWEVADLPAAVAHARAAGFPVPDPAPGPLPGTRIAIVPAAELAGVNLQLLQYDR